MKSPFRSQLSIQCVESLKYFLYSNLSPVVGTARRLVYSYFYTPAKEEIVTPTAEGIDPLAAEMIVTPAAEVCDPPAAQVIIR